MVKKQKYRRWLFSAITHYAFPVDELDRFTANQLLRTNALDVTGRVIFVNEKFISILEGTEESLANYGRVIEGDERHTGIATIQFKAIECREFSDWSACYQRPMGHKTRAGAINLLRDIPPTYLGFPQDSETYIYFYAFWRAEVSAHDSRDRRIRKYY
ncbi:MAG: BLUF domain-containing protein [Pseudomonadota bacterium]